MNKSYQLLTFKQFCCFLIGCLLFVGLFSLFFLLVTAAFYPMDLPSKNIESVQLSKILNEIKLKAKVEKNIRMTAPVFSFYSEGAAIIEYPDGIISLWFTPDMLSLPEDVFAAVVAHELGHLVSGHVEDRKDYHDLDPESKKREQAEADAWAIRWVGRESLERALARFLPREEANNRLKEAEKILSLGNPVRSAFP